MINVVYQLLRDENKTIVLSVVFVFTFLASISAVSDNQHCQSDYGARFLAEVAVERVDSAGAISSDIASADLAGTPADLAPYSYGFYSQNYFLESIHARTPAAFALLS